MILAEPTGCHHQFIVLSSDIYKKKKKKIHKYAKFHVNSITGRDEILHARLDDILTNKQTSGQVKISKSRKNKVVFKLTCISVSLCNGFLFLLINSGMCIGFKMYIYIKFLRSHCLFWHWKDSNVTSAICHDLLHNVDVYASWFTIIWRTWWKNYVQNPKPISLKLDSLLYKNTRINLRFSKLFC